MGATRTGVIELIICMSVVDAPKQGAPVLPRHASPVHHENCYLPPPAFASMPQHTSASGLPPTYPEQHAPFPSPHAPTVTDICVSCPLCRPWWTPWLGNSRINELPEFPPPVLHAPLHSLCSVCSVCVYLAICGPHNVIPPDARLSNPHISCPPHFLPLPPPRPTGGLTVATMLRRQRGRRIPMCWQCLSSLTRLRRH